MTRLDELTDDELIRGALAAGRDGAARYLDPLFRRHERRVAGWCLRVSGRREDAGDLAQEVFLRVTERLQGFRFESSFTTWLYLVARSVAINRGISARRRQMVSIDEEGFTEPAAVEEPEIDRLDREQQVERLRQAIDAELDPQEARIFRLHFVEGLTLPAIDRLLELTNRSGAKAYLVSAKRKLRKYFQENGR